VTNQSREDLLEFLKQMKAYSRKRQNKAQHPIAERYWDGQQGAYGIVQEYVWKCIKKEG
jgi:hypothetical protein